MAEQLIPSIVVQVIATVSGAIVSVGLPLILSKLNKINKLQTTVFGLDDVDQVGGLIGTLEEHDERIKINEEEIAELTDRQKEMIDGIDDIKQEIGVEPESSNDS